MDSDVSQASDRNSLKQPADDRKHFSWQRLTRRLWGTFLVGFGYMLSPLSWWNDLVFNLPIACGFGWVVGQVRGDWFLPATAVGYWLSNLVGIVMMQFGTLDAIAPDRQQSWQHNVFWGIIGSTAYTIIVLILVKFHAIDGFAIDWSAYTSELRTL